MRPLHGGLCAFPARLPPPLQMCHHEGREPRSLRYTFHSLRILLLGTASQESKILRSLQSNFARSLLVHSTSELRSPGI